MKKKKVKREKAIYNCHIHTFTFQNSPPYLFRIFLTNPQTGEKMNLVGVTILILLAVYDLFLLTFCFLPFLIRLGVISLLNMPPDFYYTQFSIIWNVMLWFLQLILPILILFQALLIAITSFLLLTGSRISKAIILWLLSATVAKFIGLFVNRSFKFGRKRIPLATPLSKARSRRRLEATKQNAIQSVSKNLSTLSNTVNDVTTLLNALRKGLQGIIPGSNDALERYARFLSTAALVTQKNVFEEIKKQYPGGTKFIVLPMNLDHMGESLGTPPKTIHSQHNELLALATQANAEGRAKGYGKIVFPFYTVHPEQQDLGEITTEMRSGKIFGRNKFNGLKIYPNLGYKPNDSSLLKILAICQNRNIPVISHCTPTGIWQLGMTIWKRRRYGHPYNYKYIMDTYKELRICLAHFGGAEEWIRRLRQPHKRGSWAHILYEMIASGKYPNLYVDISYTIFQPRIKGWTVDLIDYLKVMLESNSRIRRRVLFGSDYYMIEQEKVTEKEICILLRSRLGDKLFFQIAHTNPRRFLGIR